jgi:site-specific recombinase XerC
MEIKVCIAEFCTSLEARGRAARTIGFYRDQLHALPDGEIETITASSLDAILAGMRRRELADATVANCIKALRTFCAWCIKRGVITSNPAGELVRPDLRHRVTIKAIRQSDLDQLIDAAEARGLCLELAILLVLADTGCRAGELSNLNLEDVDLMKMEAMCTGKTGPGELDFTERTALAIKAWLEVRPATDKAALFTTRRGRISYGRIYDCIEALAHDLGIERHNPHSIRHRVGQGWIDKGANLELVRLKLRHRDITTTAMFYGNQDRGRIKQATQRYSLVK